VPADVLDVIAVKEPELAAEIEVTKTIASFALKASLRALKGTRLIIENFEQSMKSFCSSCDVDLPDVELAPILEPRSDDRR